MVSGNIISDNPDDIKTVMAERRIVEEKWVMAIEKGNKRTKEDPVYQKLKQDGEINE